MTDNKKTILIVDDEPDLRDILSLDFTHEGYKVLSAENGKVGFDLMTQFPVDLVITDTRMPVWNGLTLLINIKNKTPELPVIMFITESSDLSVEDAYNHGAEALFSKPFDRKALKKVVQNALLPRDVLWTRKSDRHECPLKISLNFPGSGSDSLTYNLTNIGRGGIYILADEQNLPAVGVEISFAFAIPSANPTTVSGTGVVRWTRSGQIDKPSGFGLEFVEFTDSSKGALIGLINSIKTKAYIPNI